MPKLIVSMDGLVLNEFELTGARVRVGRAASNDIRLDNRAVSSEHLRILWDGTRTYVVEDLDSTNGTTLNGQRLSKKRSLENNDVIGIGKYCIKFVQEEDFDQNKLTAQGMTFEKTSVEDVIAANEKARESKRKTKENQEKQNNISLTTTLPRSIYQTRTSLTETGVIPNTTPFTNTDFQGEQDSSEPFLTSRYSLESVESTKVPKEKTAPLQARVRLIHGEIIGKEVPIDGKKPVRIGRAGHVARIVLDDGAWFLVREQGSIPSINGVAIGMQTPHRLQHGDRISVGGLLLQFLND